MNVFSHTCELVPATGSFKCHNCTANTGGDKCDECQNNYYGVPSDPNVSIVAYLFVTLFDPQVSLSLHVHIAL